MSEAEWRAHHLINIAGLKSFPDLIAAAARAGWRTDDPANMAALPATPEARDKLMDAGIQRPVHNSGHANWNKIIKNELENIKHQAIQSAISVGSDQYSIYIKDKLLQLQNKLRTSLPPMDKITINTTTEGEVYA